jgi:hypothetical protein
MDKLFGAVDPSLRLKNACAQDDARFRPETRTNGCRARGQTPPSRQERGKGGATP